MGERVHVGELDDTNSRMGHSASRMSLTPPTRNVLHVYPWTIVAVSHTVSPCLSAIPVPGCACSARGRWVFAAADRHYWSLASQNTDDIATKNTDNM